MDEGETFSCADRAFAGTFVPFAWLTPVRAREVSHAGCYSALNPRGTCLPQFDGSRWRSISQSVGLASLVLIGFSYARHGQVLKAELIFSFEPI